jgi:hypothetical protein
VEVVRPGAGDAGQLRIGLAPRHHRGEHRLGLGVLAGAEPGLAEHEARVDPAAEVQRGLGEPRGQAHVEHLAGTPCGPAQQYRFPGPPGVELPAAKP